MGMAEDFADTAAIIANLDLVVSVDTAVVHLAGAMGKPVFMLDRYDNCWRWMSGRADSPVVPGHDDLPSGDAGRLVGPDRSRGGGASGNGRLARRRQDLSCQAPGCRRPGWPPMLRHSWVVGVEPRSGDGGGRRQRCQSECDAGSFRPLRPACGGHEVRPGIAAVVVSKAIGDMSRGAMMPAGHATHSGFGNGPIAVGRETCDGA